MGYNEPSIAWRQEHRVALVAFVVLGGTEKLLFAWFQSPFYRMSRTGAPDRPTNCRMLMAAESRP